MSAQEPTEEELRAALEEQMRRITVQDVLLQTVVTLINLAGRKLGLAGEPEERDLEQARLAIEATRALVSLVPGDQAAPVKEALTHLQIAFAREAQAAGEPAAAADPGGESARAPAQEAAAAGGEERKAGGPSPGAAERARARAKIWTPPGA